MINLNSIDNLTMAISRLNGVLFERMKNCVNCDHKEVCVEVARRKAARANDYSPCGNWKMLENAEDS